MITIVDYGMGNVRSVAKALEHLGASATLTSDPGQIAYLPSDSKLFLSIERPVGDVFNKWSQRMCRVETKWVELTLDFGKPD